MNLQIFLNLNNVHYQSVIIQVIFPFFCIIFYTYLIKNDILSKIVITAILIIINNLFL